MRVAKDGVMALIEHVPDCRCDSVPAPEGRSTTVIDSRCVTAFVVDESKRIGGDG
jgi:hypothetical protein